MNKKYSVKQEFETKPLTEGTHPAVLYAMIDLGNQPYQDKKTGETKHWHRFMIMFEFPGFGSDKYTDTIICETFPSLNPSGKGWVGMHEIFGGKLGRDFTEAEKEDFDIVPFLGKTFLLTVEENDRGYMQITKSQKPTEKAEGTRELVFVGIDDFFNDEIMLKLPSFVVQKIQRSKEYEAKYMENQYGKDNNDNIPVIPADQRREEVSDEREPVRIEDVPF